MQTVVRRVSDGLLADIQQTDFLPANPTARIINAVNQMGGMAGDWAVYSVVDGLWAGINPASRQFATLSNGVISGITQSTPPTATLSAGTLAADGVAEITLTVHCHQAEYSGAVKVSIIAPDGSTTTETLTAAAGVASDVISTALVGVHQITVETVLHGLAYVSFEGV